MNGHATPGAGRVTWLLTAVSQHHNHACHARNTPQGYGIALVLLRTHQVHKEGGLTSDLSWHTHKMVLALRGGWEGSRVAHVAPRQKTVVQPMNKRPLWHDEVTRWHEDG